MIQAAAHGNGRMSHSNGISGLSDRELQVFELLKLRLGNSAIAERLGVSPKSVGTYKARIMEKLGVRTTPMLLALMQDPKSVVTQSFYSNFP